MDTKSLEMVKGMLEALAAKLGIASSHLWEVLVRQARVESYAFVCTFSAVALLVVCLFFAAWRMDKAENRRETRDNDRMAHVPFIIGMILTVISSMIFFLTFSDILSGFINPEYIAFNKLTHMLSSCR
jgi:glucose uptake protein GlcU